MPSTALGACMPAALPSAPFGQIKQIIQSVLVSTVQMSQLGTSLEGGSAFLNISNLLGSSEELKSFFNL